MRVPKSEPIRLSGAPRAASGTTIDVWQIEWQHPREGAVVVALCDKHKIKYVGALDVLRLDYATHLNLAGVTECTWCRSGAT